MKTSKRILSAILASTVALSSYAAYAAPEDPQSETANSVTGASIPVDFGGTLGDDTAAKDKFCGYLGDKPTAAYDSVTNTVTVTFSKSKADYADDGQVDEKDPVYLVIDTNIANTVEATKDEDSETGFKFVKSGGGYWWDDEAHLDYNFKNGKIKLWLPAVFDKDGEETNTKTIKYKVGNDEKEINIKYEYGSNTDVTGAEIPDDFGGNLDATATEKFNEYLGEKPDISFEDGAVTVTFKKKKSEYTNNGKVPDVDGQGDPVYLVLETGIGATVKAVGVDETAAADGFQFVSGYSWDEDREGNKHHEFNFAEGKIKLWLPAILGDEDALTVKYKVGTGTEKTVTINYVYESEDEEGGEVAVELIGIGKGIEGVDTMTDTNLENYNSNLDKYNFKDFLKKSNTAYEVTCEVNVGEMKAATAGGAEGFKNVLGVLVLKKIDDFAIGNIEKDGTPLTDTSWVADANKFVNNPGDNTYVTLWMSMVADENGEIPDRTYTIKATEEDDNPISLTVKFVDTTKYTFTNEVAENDYYTVTATLKDDKKTATVTVEPKEGVEIKSVKVKNGENELAQLTKTNGKYTGEIAVKDLLTDTETKNGIVATKLTAGNLDVKTVSDKIHLTSVAKATKADSMTGDEKARFLKNNDLVTIKSFVEGEDGNYTVNVETPFGAMEGDPANIESTGKNVMLLLKFNENDDIEILHADGETDLRTAKPEWFTDGDKFIDPGTGEMLVTLWISVTDDRIGEANALTYTIHNTQSGETQEKTLTVKFTDSTTYTLTPPAATDADKYDVAITAGTTNSKKKVTLTPKTGVEIKSATVRGIDFTQDSGKESWSGEIDVKTVLTPEEIKDGETEAALVAGDFTVATVSDKIHLVGAGKSTKPTDTMNDAGNERLTHNNNKITINPIVTSEDGKNYTITVDTKFGEMMGDPDDIDSTGKNALIMLEFDKDDDISIKKTVGGDVLPAVWKTDAPKFVQTPDANKQYFTLWVSVTDARIASDGVVYTIYNTQGAETQEKTLTVKFTDSTTYTLSASATDSECKFNISVGSVDSNGEALVTVTPKNEGETITAATLNKAVGTVTLTPDGNGGYAAKVAVKDLLTNDEIKEGIVAKALAAADFTVTVLAQSATVVAKGMTVGIAAPASMAEGAGLTRYQNNRKLYADKLVWDDGSRTATLKVPAELMNGANTSAEGGANVCLVLKLETALEAVDGSYGLTGTGIEDIDVEDGWKFVEGATEDNKGEYVVLWINAHKDAFTNNSKVVVYTTTEDDTEEVIATVNLVKIPGVKRNATATATSADATNENIITAAKTLLDGTDKETAVNYEVTGLATVDGTTTATVKVTPKDDTVLVNDEGTVVPSLNLSVNVTVTSETKYTATAEATTNGTIALKYKADPSDTELADLPAVGVTAGTEVTIVLTGNPGYTGTATVVNAVSGEEVSVSNNKFTMPIGGVTVSATFAQNQTTPTTPGSGGGSWGGGGSSSGGGSGSSATTGVTLNTLPYATVSADKNAFSGEVTATLKTGESTTASGVTIKTDEVEKAANGASVKIEAPKSTYDINNWSREMVKNTANSKASEVKKSVDEAIKAVGDGKGFALYATITKDGKSVEPDGNVEITVSVPEAFKGKELHVYRITNRGAVEILANTANDKVTFMAGGSGEYIFTTEKLTNVKTYELGNVDGDAHTSAKDATLTLKYLIRSEMLKDEYLFTADADGNGLVNAADATAILKYLVEKA